MACVVAVAAGVAACDAKVEAVGGMPNEGTTASAAKSGTGAGDASASATASTVTTATGASVAVSTTSGPTDPCQILGWEDCNADWACVALLRNDHVDANAPPPPPDVGIEARPCCWGCEVPACLGCHTPTFSQCVSREACNAVPDGACGFVDPTACR